MSAPTPLMEVYKDVMVVVPVGDVDAVDFTKMPAIGTDCLNGGTVIVLACPLAAILAHMPRLPPSPSDHALTVSMDELQRILSEVGARYANMQADGQGHHLRAQDTVSMVVAAQDGNGELQAPHHVVAIVSELRALGLAPTIHPYETEALPEDNSSLMVVSLDFGDGQELPRLYVADELVHWEY
ncbi:hypothetical protein HMPREF1624_05302 [Sporothrix schenckii ATCC 58251]|uniref:Uncharacterized protein n=1 Tax=Sporothrix schenckii (strain ATCC 58251 / de Perez 2211183) TaxID=1391915 RepID=U7PSA9_SPOS1|nr:hypothetical protein HMPREF1624_05302 [Sporothrix schenckii ATCC 58251]